MIFIIASFVVQVLVYFFLPALIKRYAGKEPVSRLPLLVGGLLFLISWYIPSFDIRGQYTAFTTHFLGGIYAGFIWLYIISQLHWRPPLFLGLIGLFFLVSGLGIANELFELGVTELKIVNLDPSDTWWDLLANTLGVLLFWVGYNFYSLLRK